MAVEKLARHEFAEIASRQEALQTIFPVRIAIEPSIDGVAYELNQLGSSQHISGLGNADKSNCNFVSYLQIHRVGWRDKNVKLVPIFIQDQANFLIVSIGFRFPVLLRCPESLILRFKSMGDLVPVDAVNLGPNVFADEAVTSGSTIKNPVPRQNSVRFCFQ